MKKRIMLAGLTLAGISAAVFATQVFTRDVIIRGSECVGTDCEPNEVFGADTLRLKENNLSIKFEDTSASPDYPANDWAIMINDAGTGGMNYFGIMDVDANTFPFRIKAGAGNNSFFVDQRGFVGVGTDMPQAPLHVQDNDALWRLNAIVENTNPINFAGIRLSTPAGWIDINNSQGEFRLNFDDSVSGPNGPEMVFDSNGDLRIKGDVTFMVNGQNIRLSDLVQRLEALENPPAP